MDSAIHSILESVKGNTSLLNAYYALPVLSNKSLLNISSIHCKKAPDSGSPVARFNTRTDTKFGVKSNKNMERRNPQKKLLDASIGVFMDLSICDALVDAKSEEHTKNMKKIEEYREKLDVARNRVKAYFKKLSTFESQRKLWTILCPEKADNARPNTADDTNIEENVVLTNQSEPEILLQTLLILIQVDGRSKMVELPWIRSLDELPINRDIAGKRQVSTSMKLLKSYKFACYNVVFEEWKNEYFTEDSGEGFGHYLPHRGIFKNESTTKVRPVFDASCKSKREEISLIYPKPTPVLGLLWSKSKDVLFCDNSALEISPDTITRRVILFYASRVFDPICFTSPVCLPPKIHLLESWRSKVSWDSEASTDMKKTFLKWIEDIKMLHLGKIPTKFLISNVSSFSFQVFCNDSVISYEAAVFIRCQSAHETSIQLLVAKSRIAPLKSITIPRLELLACCIGARLSNFV
ncbi:integrase core domain protein [Trichonephila clavipes]|nr:integrase core domain protein [Trichonephila clavipes]